MKPTKEELEVLKLYAILTHSENKYVWLRKDKEGTYIEYAFKDGTPHDNRCLSWYFSLQPNAIERNKKAFGCTDPECIQHEIERREKKIEKYIDGLFTLHSFTCGHEEYPESSLKECEENWNKYCEGSFIKEDHICRVGSPAPNCIKNKTCSHWTYKEPVKCACWDLSEINGLPKSVCIPMEDAIRLQSELLKK